MIEGGERRGGDVYPVLDSSHEGGSVGRPGLLTRRNCKLDNYLCRLSGSLPNLLGASLCWEENVAQQWTREK